jgi:hypothetical protein
LPANLKREVLDPILCQLSGIGRRETPFQFKGTARQALKYAAALGFQGSQGYDVAR